MRYAVIHKILFYPCHESDEWSSICSWEQQQSVLCFSFTLPILSSLKAAVMFPRGEETIGWRVSSCTSSQLGSRAMAERRLRTILLHLSPPSTSRSSCSTEVPGASPSSFRSSGGSQTRLLDDSPQPSHRTMSISCDYSHLCRLMERSNSDENSNQKGGEKSAGGKELESCNIKELDTHGKSLRLAYRGPSGNREDALFAILLRSKMQRVVIGQGTSEVNDQLDIEICRGGQFTGDNFRECKDDSECGGVKIDNVGVGTKDKWVVIEVEGVELNSGTRKVSGEKEKEREDNQGCHSSKGSSQSLEQREYQPDHFRQENQRINQREIENEAVATGYGGPQKAWGLVRADTTMDVSIQKSKNNSGGQGKGIREATCVFCDIIHGAAPCLKLYEDEACLCILDINPLSFGHSLILPKAHFRSLEATPPQVAAAMCAAVPLISSALLEATHCDSFNMLVNSGVAAGQVIFHTHFHIIPRCAGDGLWQSESTFRKVSNQLHASKLLAHMVRTKLSSSTQ